MPTPPSERRTLDERAEQVWKWLLRLAGLGAFLYVLIVKGGAVPLGTYVILGGLIGLPNAVSLQQILNARSGGGS